MTSLDLDASGSASQPGGALPRPLRPGFRQVVLVCKACENRSKGPAKLGAKSLAKLLRRACRDAGVARPRIVFTSCLGACPKKAFTVAAPAASGVAMIAFRRGDDPAAAVAALFAGSEPAYSNSTSSAPSST